MPLQVEGRPTRSFAELEGELLAHRMGDDPLQSPFEFRTPEATAKEPTVQFREQFVRPCAL